MADSGYQRFIDGLEFSLARDSVSAMRDCESEDTLEAYMEYVRHRLELIELAISNLPGRTNASLLEIARGARIIAKRHQKHPSRVQKKVYNHDTSILYALPIEDIESATKPIIEAYNYLYRVCLGIIQKRNGDNNHLLPLNKDRWLEP